jgi:hypothetical protein
MLRLDRGQGFLKDFKHKLSCVPRPCLMLVLHGSLRYHFDDELAGVHLPLISFVLLGCLCDHLHQQVANVIFRLGGFLQTFWCLIASCALLWLSKLILMSLVIFLAIFTCVVCRLVATILAAV